MAVRVFVGTDSDTAVAPPSDAVVWVLIGRTTLPLPTEDTEKREALADATPGEFRDTLEAEYTELRFNTA